MTIKTGNVTVGPTATSLLSSADGDAIPGQGMSCLVVSGGPVWFGGADVTADAAADTGGRSTATGATFEFDLASGSDKPYGRVASGTAIVHVSRTGA